ncbi:MAG: hypothetical protein ABI551_02775, partial [Polyangiaceae bacterium]
AIAAPLSLQACMGTMPAGDDPIETTGGDAGHAGGEPSVDLDAGDASAADAAAEDGGAPDDDAAEPQEDGGDAGL